MRPQYEIIDMLVAEVERLRARIAALEEEMGGYRYPHAWTTRERWDPEARLSTSWWACGGCGMRVELGGAFPRGACPAARRDGADAAGP